MARNVYLKRRFAPRGDIRKLSLKRRFTDGALRNAKRIKTSFIRRLVLKTPSLARPIMKYGLQKTMKLLPKVTKYLSSKVTGRSSPIGKPNVPSFMKSDPGTLTKSINNMTFASQKRRAVATIKRNMSGNKVFSTWYEFNASPIIACNTTGQNLYQSPTNGMWPSLYWNYDYSLTSQSFGQLKPYVFSSDDNLFPYTPGTVHVFLADWLYECVGVKDFANNAAGQNMRMVRVVDNVNDPNNCLLYNDLVTNKDWQRIIHLKTDWKFTITNWYPCKATIEILFYKYVPDPDGMNYSKQAIAPMSDELDVEDYCRKKDYRLGSKQIRVIKRKRFTINGLTNYIDKPTGATISSKTITPFGNNVREYKFSVKRKYSMTRPIPQTESDISGLSEYNFQSTFYNRTEAVYCRIQAWPSKPNIVYNQNSNFSYLQPDSSYEDVAIQTSSANNGKMRPSVQVIGSKRSYFQLDEAIMKGPFRNTT